MAALTAAPRPAGDGVHAGVVPRMFGADVPRQDAMRVFTRVRLATAVT
ncbi:hypothetical protein [Deinococcus sonorensis]|uniref:Uncharacterized protein n=2 Tax=Deinococcus sonorensis TaxID=309891 RepID=A0AAU7U5E7_9DEIO